jgi:hypothetical protein
MVNVMGKAKCNGETPQIEIALYEYGRDNNDLQKGYVKQSLLLLQILMIFHKNYFSLAQMVARNIVAM